MDNSWGLLKTKFIIEILQGDTVIGHFENQEKIGISKWTKYL